MTIRRWLAWGLALAATAVAGVGLARLRIDDDLRSLIDDGRPGFAAVDEAAAIFGPSDRDCVVRATARTGDVFSPEALAALGDLADRLRGLEGVERVRSILDVRRQGMAGAVLPVVPRTEAPLDPARGDAARERAVRHPLVAGQLLSADATSSLLLVRLDAAHDRGGGLGDAVARIEKVLAESGDRPLALELTGMPALREQGTRALGRDMLTFNALGLVLAVILAGSVARSVRSTVVACLPPFVGAIWAMGLLGLVGAPVNVLTAVVPSLALVVGTCDSIHFIEDLRRSVRRRIAPADAAAGAVARVGSACGLTSIVTAVGFASLAAARIEAVRTFGIVAAVGALASFAAVTLLTPLLATSPLLGGAALGRSSRRASRLANRLASVSVRHARPAAATAVAVTLALALAGGRLDADIRISDSLPRHAPAARSLAEMDADFGGVMGIDVLVGWPAGIDWRSGEVIEALGAAAAALAADDTVSRPVSLAAVVADVPPRAVRRLDPAPLADLVAPSERLAIVRARVPDLGSRALEVVYGRIDARLAELARARPGWRFELTGVPVVSARNVRQLVHDLGSSLLVEVAVIGCILAIAFRSPIAGVVSLLPNVFPLAVIAASLALGGRRLDPASVIVFNVCLGLAVDDTVHVLAAVRRQRRRGAPMATAVRRAIAETGNAVVIGGVVLATGFAAVTVSSVPSLQGFGRLACLAVAAATLAELVFLPALLVVVDRLVRGRGLADGMFGAVEPARAEPTPSAGRQPAVEAA